MTQRKIKIYQIKYIPKVDVHDINSNKENHQKNLTEESDQILPKMVCAEGFKTL